MGSVGSVQFQIVPCSSLYLFSSFISPLQCLVSVNYRVLICHTCHIQSSSLFRVYFGFLCLQVSSVSNFCPGTRGRRWSLTYLGSLVQCVGEGNGNLLQCLCLGLALGSPIFPSGCEGKLGDALESLQGRRDLT